MWCGCVVYEKHCIHGHKCCMGRNVDEYHAVFSIVYLCVWCGVYVCMCVDEVSVYLCVMYVGLCVCGGVCMVVYVCSVYVYGLCVWCV